MLQREQLFMSLCPAPCPLARGAAKSGHEAENTPFGIAVAASHFSVAAARALNVP